MRNLIAVAALAATACAATGGAQEGILGTRPAYLGEIARSFPNVQAVKPRMWAPGLEEGWTPQGLALVGKHFLVSAYQDTDKGRPSCRVFRLEVASGSPAGHFDMPDPCRHAGGITDIGGGYVVVADTRQDWKVDLAKALAAGKAQGATRGMIKLARGFGSAFTFFDGKDLWNGVFAVEKDAADSKIYRLDLGVFDRLDGQTIDGAVALEIVPVPILAQGAALDREGNLWLAASYGPLQSYLYRLDRRTGAALARYGMPSRIEGIVFDADNRLWAISESGSRKYHNGRDDDFPFIFEIDVARLR
jgi:hypothetical protein